MNRILISFAVLALLLSGCYKDEIDDLNRKVDNLTGQYETIRSALDAKQTITDIADTDNGYRITFSDGKTIDIENGSTPVFTVGNNGNWFIDGTDTGTKAEGNDGAAPEIIDGNWHIGDTDTGVRAEGGSDAPAITSIIISNGEMTFTFSDGSLLIVPMSGGDSELRIEAYSVQYFMYGESKEFMVSSAGVEKMAVSKPDGWKASMNGNTLTVTAPVAGNIYAEMDGRISIVATGGSSTAIADIDVHARDVNYVIDFEDPRVSDYLAGPTAYGDNLYDGYESQYVGYDDAGSGLLMMINDVSGTFNFWNGGIAISQWNDMVTEGFMNQCSAYSSDFFTGKGGYGGSATFAVSNGSSTVSFADDVTECTFDNFMVTNSTYAVLSMMNGDGYAKKFEAGDWFKLVITALDKDGVSTGTAVEFYLADFRTPVSPGIITEWTNVDLKPLGSHVNTIKFDLQSTDNGNFGMNTPAYFCFDNLAMKK